MKTPVALAIVIRLAKRAAIKQEEIGCDGFKQIIFNQQHDAIRQIECHLANTLMENTEAEAKALDPT
ncbi:hypothetical protein LCGC14_1809120 [marine sediment metagenome]|uniref:Uncharacterized protein n=1 Tax=marine sediment metagenome TaxID=412755 RepID=A0A0F9JLY4_9ZZZZ